MENDNVLAILRQRELLAAFAHFRRGFFFSFPRRLSYFTRDGVPSSKTRIKLSTGVKKEKRRGKTHSWRFPML